MDSLDFLVSYDASMFTLTIKAHYNQKIASCVNVFEKLVALKLICVNVLLSLTALIYTYSTYVLYITLLELS